MHIPCWLLPRPPTATERLQRVLRAALRDPYYTHLVTSQGEPDLASFPFIASDRWRRDHRPAVQPKRMPHPLNRRVVAVSPVAAKMRAAISASAPLLLACAQTIARQRPRAEFAALVLERPGDRELSDSERDDLWDAFQVPIFRVLMGFDGTVLAYECEAFSGLHATAHAIFEEHAGALYVTSLSDTRRPSIRLLTDVAARLEHSPCQCGRPGLRLAPAWREQSGMSSAAD